MFQHHQYSHLSAVNLEELTDRRQSLVAGYCQGAVVFLHAISNLLFTCHKTCAWASLLNPSRSTLKYKNKYVISHYTCVLYATNVFQLICLFRFADKLHQKHFVHLPKIHGSKRIKNIQNKQRFDYTKLSSLTFL